VCLSRLYTREDLWDVQTWRDEEAATGQLRLQKSRGWTRLHNEELHNLHASPSIVGVIKSRSMRWAAHVAPMG